jgi:hypothetical protein
MRAPAIFAAIALGALNPSIIWAEATVAEAAKSGPTAAHRNSVTLSRVGPRLPNTGSQLGAASSTAVRGGTGQSPALRPRNRTAPNNVRFTPNSSEDDAAAGLSGSDLRRGVPAAPVLGGPAKYDAKKGAVIGARTIGHKR